MTPAELAAIEARADAATPGPLLEREETDYYQGGTYLGVGPQKWERDVSRGGNHLVDAADGEEPEQFKHNVCRIEGSEADAEFLKRAQVDVASLAAEVRADKAAMAAVESVLSAQLEEGCSLDAFRSSLAQQAALLRERLGGWRA